jgi:hypothetical protein
MTFRRFAIAGFTLAIVVPTLGGTAMAGHSGKTKQVNATGQGPKTAFQYPVAGSKRYLAYIEAPPTSTVQLIHDLHVRTAGGKTTDYGQTYDKTFSLAPPMLTSSGRDGRRTLYSPTVGWWDLSTGHSGRLSIPKDHRYLGAAPNGILLLRTRAPIVIQRLSLGGKLTTLGDGPSSDTNNYLAYVSDRGFVLRTLGASSIVLSFQAWNDPGAFTTLQTGAGDTSSVTCSGMTATYIGCSVGFRPTLIPLDGGPPSTTALAYASRSAATGNTVVYADPSDPGGQWTLGSYTAGDAAPQASTTGVTELLVSAFGKVIVQSTDQSLLAATDADHTSVLVPSHEEVATVERQGYLPGRIVWVDDLKNPAHPTDLATVRQRVFHVHGGRLRLSSRKVVGGLPSGDEADSSSEFSLYLQTGQRSVAWGDVATQKVNVVSPHGKFTRPGYLYGVSNRWLVTRVADNSYELFDMKRRKSSTIGLHASSFNGIAVSGGRMAVIAHRGLQVIDLATQHRHTIAKRKKAPAHQVDQVFMAGPRVAWTDGNGDTHIRNLATGHTIVLHRYMESLSAHAAVLMTHNGHEKFDGYLANFHGTQRKVLSGVSGYSHPLLQGRVLTWISELGQLKAKVVSLP